MFYSIFFFFFVFNFIYYTLSLGYIDNQNKHQNTVNLLNSKIYCTLHIYFVHFSTISYILGGAALQS